MDWQSFAIGAWAASFVWALILLAIAIAMQRTSQLFANAMSAVADALSKR